MNLAPVKDKAYFAAEKERRRKARYLKMGNEYEALFCAVKDGEPSVEAAELAFGRRLLVDLGELAADVYRTVFTKLSNSKNYDWTASAEEWAGSYANFILKRVAQKRFTSGHQILGFRASIKQTLYRLAHKELTEAHIREPFTVESDPDDYADMQNPELLKVAEVVLLPHEVLRSLSQKDRFVLAALEAHEHDREATAAYLEMTVRALNKRLERIKEAASLENLRLTLANLGEADRASALAVLFLPLVLPLQMVSLSDWPCDFSVLGTVQSSSKTVCNGYHSTVFHILKKWKAQQANEMEAH